MSGARTSVEAVVRKDFRDGLRSRLLWVLVGLYFLVLSGWAWAFSSGVDQVEPGTDLIQILGVPAILVLLLIVPTTGLAVSVKSIVRERELGSIKILLSLPHTRAEVMAGKFLGRAGLLSAAVVAGFLPAGLILLFRIDGVSMGNYVVFVLLALLFGLAFLAVGIGLSALFETETRASVAGVVAYFALLLGDFVFGEVNQRLELFEGATVIFIRRFNLIYVFWDLFATFAPAAEDGSSATTFATTFVNPQVLMDSGVLDGETPFYLEAWFATVVLLLWIAVPLAVGYYRFETTDL